MNILYFATIYKKPDFKPFFELLADELHAKSHKFRGLHWGYQEEEGKEEFTFQVDTVPFNASLNSTKYWTNEDFQEIAEADLSVAADFEEPADRNEAYKNRITHVFAAFRTFFSTYLRTHRIDLVILGHQFSGAYHVARTVCESLKVSFVYNHPGVLPGTMEFEPRGRLAESDVYQQRELYDQKIISKKDRSLAKRYIESFREGTNKLLFRPGKSPRSNRNELTRFEANLEQTRAKNKKTILLVGGVDYRCGISPTSYPQHSTHSPWIRSNTDAVFELMERASTMGFEVVYKPHPASKEATDFIERKSGLTVVRKITIFDLIQRVDALVSICSASAYEASLFSKPVIQLGRLAFSGRNLTLEAYSGEQLTLALEKALTPNRDEESERQKRFEEHVARLLRYSLSSIDPKGSPLCGCDIGTTANRLIKHIESQPRRNETANESRFASLLQPLVRMQNRLTSGTQRIRLLGDHSAYHGGSAAVWDHLSSLIDDSRHCRADSGDYDVLIVNGEGSMHHLSPSFRKKFSEIERAIQAQKRVYLINSVWQNNLGLDRELVKQIDGIVVREEASRVALRDEYKVDSIVRLDLSYSAEIDTSKHHDYEGAEVMTDFYVPEAKCFMKINGGPLSRRAYFDLKTQTWSQSVHSLKTASMLITGRHHAVFAACKAEIPFVAVSGNTHKIEGFARMSGIDLPILGSMHGISDAIKWTKQNSNAYADFFDWMRSQRKFALKDIDL